MKKIIAVLALLFCTNGFCQTMEALKSESKKFLEALQSRDTDAELDLTYYKVFEEKDRSVIRAQKEKSIQNDEIETTFYPIEVLSYSDLMTIDGHTFCVIRARMRMDNKYPNLSKSSAKETVALIKKRSMFKDVVWNDETKTIEIRIDSPILGIADEGTKNNWQFLLYHPSEFSAYFNDDIKKQLGL